MSKIRKLKMEDIISRLKTISRIATMNTANFNHIDPLPFPKKEEEVDRFIKRETKLWRDSWIVEPLKTIIQELEIEIKR